MSYYNTERETWEMAPRADSDKFDAEKMSVVESIPALNGDEFDDEDPNLDPAVALEDDSPYPEVRAAVANTDDMDMTASSIRTWVIGTWLFLSKYTCPNLPIQVSSGQS